MIKWTHVTECKMKLYTIDLGFYQIRGEPWKNHLGQFQHVGLNTLTRYQLSSIKPAITGELDKILFRAITEANF